MLGRPEPPGPPVKPPEPGRQTLSREPALAGRSTALDVDLVGWGKAIVLESRGRTSGEPRQAALGFVEEPDGSLLVSADGDETHWARNLLADPRCRVGRDGHWQDHVAERLGPADHRRAVAGLVLRYGTPAERLGSGPSFRLVPAERGAGAPAAGMPPSA